MRKTVFTAILFYFSLHYSMPLCDSGAAQHAFVSFLQSHLILANLGIDCDPLIGHLQRQLWQDYEGWEMGRVATLIRLTSLSLSTPPITVSHAALCLQEGAECGISLVIHTGRPLWPFVVAGA